MRRNTLAVVAAVVLSLTLSANSVAVADPGVRSVDDLAWMAGHWGGDGFGGQVEEGWFAPRGGSLSGMFRLVQNDVAVMYELMLIEQDDDGEIYLRFKHVARGWEPWEEEALEYHASEMGDRNVTFRRTSDEPVQNAPAWFTYASPSETSFVVTIYGGEEPIVLSMTRQ